MGALIGGIEMGGTKIVCGLFEAPLSSDVDAGDAPRLLARGRVPTGLPADSLGAVKDWFDGELARLGRAAPDALGIGSFGPLDPRPQSPKYGQITTTPKPNWAGCDVVGFFRAAYGIPIGFDTDVDAAALGEYRWGAGRGRSCLVYLTVGTGIGGGVVVDGRIHHGASHPEMGHVRVSRFPGDDFGGSCPYHGDCLEGMASGPAVERRWKERGENLPPGHPAWALEARYLAAGIAAMCFVMAPDRLVLGGGIGGRADILEAVRRELPAALGSYISDLDGPEAIADFLVGPGLGENSGLVGAAALGCMALEGARRA